MERPEHEQRSTAAEALLDLSTSCRAQDTKDNVQNKHTQALPMVENSRERLRPWLITMIDSGAVPGLDWLNEEKTKFKIPWKHAGKHEYNQDRDSLLFKEWAKYTGKYREDVDKPEPAVWKTRLRCALNKHPKIHEVKNESQPEDFHNPYKVYVFQDKTDEKMPVKKPLTTGRLLGTSLEGYETAEGPVISYNTNPSNERVGSKRPLVPAGHLILTSPESISTSAPEPITQRAVAIVTRWRGTPEPEDNISVVNKTIKIEGQQEASTNTAGFVCRTTQPEQTFIKNNSQPTGNVAFVTATQPIQTFVKSTSQPDLSAKAPSIMGRMFFKISPPNPHAQPHMIVDVSPNKCKKSENMSPNPAVPMDTRPLTIEMPEDLAPKPVTVTDGRFVKTEKVEDTPTDLSIVKEPIQVKTKNLEDLLARKPPKVEEKQVKIEKPDNVPMCTTTPMEVTDIKTETPQITSEHTARFTIGRCIKVDKQDGSSNNCVLTDQKQLSHVTQERRELITYHEEPLVRQEPSPVNGQKINVCPLCGDRTASVPEFDAHMRAHQWEKPYMCGECGFRTGTKTALSKHMKAHFPSQET
uniref:Interferon regulatory factor 4 n=1 Tax=Branchiostoma belcheri tsingtauense TaxID=155462 RepID=A0A0A7P6Z6_BRABE|nr:interferon regulatory factor 4 [Branchiostoma belcheri tsingtauense]